MTPLPPIAASLVASATYDAILETASAALGAAAALRAPQWRAGAALGAVARQVVFLGVAISATWVVCTHFKGDVRALQGALQTQSARAAEGAVRLLSGAVTAAMAGGKSLPSGAVDAAKTGGKTW